MVVIIISASLLKCLEHRGVGGTHRRNDYLIEWEEDLRRGDNSNVF